MFSLRNPTCGARLDGYSVELVDDHTLEVEMSKEQNLNEIFARLSALGIEVLSMRNKVNRLEEIFMRLVENRARHEHAAPCRWRRSAAVGFQTIVIREYGRIMRIWGQTLVPSAVTATLYFVIFGSLIGRRIGPMDGFDYRAYIAPGLIMMSVITNSYGNVVSSFFGAKFGKHVEELLVSPLPNWIIVAGYAIGGVIRGLMVGLVVTLVALFFARLHWGIISASSSARCCSVPRCSRWPASSTPYSRRTSTR